jgi:hypothetical protein
MKNQHYTMFEDSGHGWLRVSMQEIRELKIEDIISGFSYISGDGETAYLEEDCDFSTFLREKEAAGEAVNMKSIDTRHSENCFVRNLSGFPHGKNFDAYSANGYKRPEGADAKKA